MKHIIALTISLLLLSSCTYVNADISNGTIDVWTFMTSRQDVVISRDENGAVTWKASRSDADSTIAQAALNVTKIAAKASGVEVP